MEEKNEGRDVRSRTEQDNDETVNNKNEEVIGSRGVLVDKSGVTYLDIWQHFKVLLPLILLGRQPSRPLHL